ncbi:MAG: Bro-N domain-containing protein [Rickettsiales bacterium]|jgi:prophage antirepressor-like protein|nr:Bro-N domain-containing protein [Rickettsiales bacterium]
MDDIIIFENKKVRRKEHNGEWFFSVVDMVGILTESEHQNARNYWKVLKNRLMQEGANEPVTKCNQLKLVAEDGKMRETDCANIETMFRIIQSIPSPKAEPFKQWLAKVGYERLQELENPEIAQQRMMEIYKQKGYNEDWINRRIQSIKNRKELTNEWDVRGALKSDYKIFTSLMSKETFGITPTEHKQIKNIKTTNNLRDHMSETELILTMLGEVTAKEIHKGKNTKGRINLKNDIIKAGKIAGEAREKIEKETGKPVISSKNHLKLK